MGGKKWLQQPNISDSGDKARSDPSQYLRYYKKNCLQPASPILEARSDCSQHHSLARQRATAANIAGIRGKNWRQPISKLLKARRDCSQHLPYWRIEANAANTSDIGSKKRWSDCHQYPRYWRQEEIAVDILRHWRLDAIAANISDIAGKKRWSDCSQYLRYWRQEETAANIHDIEGKKGLQPTSSILKVRSECSQCLRYWRQEEMKPLLSISEILEARRVCSQYSPT